MPDELVRDRDATLFRLPDRVLEVVELPVREYSVAKVCSRPTNVVSVG